MTSWGGDQRTWGNLFDPGGTWGDYGNTTTVPVLPPAPQVSAAAGPLTFYAYDLATRRIVDEIPFSTFKFGDILNRPGGWSATISAHHEKCNPGNLAEDRTAIIVDQGGELRFAGILWDIKVTGGILTCGGNNLWDYFAHRYIRNDQTYTATDQFQIVQGLLLAAQFGLRESIGLTVRWPALSGVLRDRTYLATERKQYRQAVEDLAEVENGFEFSLTAQWSGGQPIFFLDLAHPRRGQVTDHVWQLNKTVALAGDWTRDGTGFANRVDAIGSGTGATKLIGTGQANPAALRMEQIVTFTDVKVPATIDAHANGELGRANQPQEQLKVRVVDLAQFGLGAWSTGDQVWVVGDLGYTVLDDSYRIQGYEVSSDVNGALTVTCDLILGANLGKPVPMWRKMGSARRRDLERRLANLERA